MQMDFPAGYGMAGISWVQLFFLCEFGEHIQVRKIQNDFLSDSDSICTVPSISIPVFFF